MIAGCYVHLDTGRIWPMSKYMNVDHASVRCKMLLGTPYLVMACSK